MTTTRNSEPRREQRLLTILRDDMRRADFMRTIRHEFSELKEVMLTQERLEQLEGMSLLRRGIAIGWWLLKSLIRKLTPTRRLLFVIALLNLSAIRFEIGNTQFDLPPSLGVVIIVFLLMLELKDKLLAHEELQAGNEVQKALMPERNPQVPGWQIWLFTRSANEVGGDLVDFIRQGGNHRARRVELGVALLVQQVEDILATERSTAAEQHIQDATERIQIAAAAGRLPN
jgi:hypothetical protein